MPLSSVAQKHVIKLETKINNAKNTTMNKDEIKSGFRTQNPFDSKFNGKLLYLYQKPPFAQRQTENKL